MLRPLPVPILKLHPHEIQLANDAAILQWNGYDYVSGDPVQTDHYFLSTFSSELKKTRSPPIAHATFSYPDVREFIDVCGIRVTLVRKSELDFPNMEAYLSANYSSCYTKARNAVPAGDSLTDVTDFLIDASRAVVKQNLLLPGRIGHRVALTSRLLFFAAPECLIFNYSRPLAMRKLKYGTQPRVAYPKFAKAMLDGLRTNWGELSKYNIPFDHNGQRFADIFDLYDTHWWARRVLDIALLIKHNVFTPTVDLPLLRRQCQYDNQPGATCNPP